MGPGGDGHYLVGDYRSNLVLTCAFPPAEIVVAKGWYLLFTSCAIEASKEIMPGLRQDARRFEGI